MVKIIRWLARIIGSLLVLLLITFAIGEGFPNPFTLTLIEFLLFVAVIIMMVGQIVAWNHEGFGGLLQIIGFLFFVVVEGDIFVGPIFPLFFVTGLMYLFCWWRSRN